MGVDQKEHWNQIYTENKTYFGDSPSLFCVRCADAMKMLGLKTVLELGPGQGRDTKYLIDKGFSVIAADYSDASCCQLSHKFGDRLTVVQTDLRKGIDLPANSIDACYAHMLLTMDFSDDELKKIMGDIKKILSPNGFFFFSVRNMNDSGFGKGENIHGNVWENDAGFAVRFYSQDDIEMITKGFDVSRVNEFSEGQKVLYGVVLKKIADQ